MSDLAISAPPILFVCCIGPHRIITAMWFENSVHGVAHGDDVGSQNTELLAKIRCCKQTEFFSMWDYLWTDKEIAQLQVWYRWTQNLKNHS